MHDTPDRLAAVPLGLPIFSSDQLLPFQRSARLPPTAMHLAADGQDTAPRPPPLAAFGVLEIDHLVPFHTSASVLSIPFLNDSPTAKHLVLAGQETPSRSLSG